MTSQSLPELDTRIRLSVYDHLVRSGSAPSIRDIGDEIVTPLAAVFRRLGLAGPFWQLS